MSAHIVHAGSRRLHLASKTQRGGGHNVVAKVSCRTTPVGGKAIVSPISPEE